MQTVAPAPPSEIHGSPGAETSTRAFKVHTFSCSTSVAGETASHARVQATSLHSSFLGSLRCVTTASSNEALGCRSGPNLCWAPQKEQLFDQIHSILSPSGPLQGPLANTSRTRCLSSLASGKRPSALRDQTSEPNHLHVRKTYQLKLTTLTNSLHSH